MNTNAKKEQAVTLRVVKHEAAAPPPENKSASGYRVAAHLIDEKLKYNYEGTQTNVTGVRLTDSENKLIFCLCKLLHHSSSNSSKPKEADFYGGNIGCMLASYGDGEADAPRLCFKLHQLVKEYKGGDRVTGKDIINVQKLLKDLESKKFQISHVEQTKKRGGGRIERKIEYSASLIKNIELSETEYNKDNKIVSRKSEIVIALNPIFRQQINTKFLSYPDDFIKRVQTANGSKRVNVVTFRLIDYLNRARSSKKYNHPIGLNKLYYTLSDNYMKQQRKGKVKKLTEKALVTCVKIGLLKSYTYGKLKGGEPKITFKINENWQ